MLSIMFIALQVAQPAVRPCAAAERAQFDFWVGQWDVYATGTTNLVAHSLIEKLYDGCAIRENWMPFANAGGGSISAYLPKKGKWQQTWIDSTGELAVFEGGRQGSSMIIEGVWPNVAGPGRDALVRITYTPGTDGAVRQSGVQSTDNGKSWQPSFDFTYKRAKQDRPQSE
jgi:hypothetical protein